MPLRNDSPSLHCIHPLVSPFGPLHYITAGDATRIQVLSWQTFLKVCKAVLSVPCLMVKMQDRQRSVDVIKV